MRCSTKSTIVHDRCIYVEAWDAYQRLYTYVCIIYVCPHTYACVDGVKTSCTAPTLQKTSIERLCRTYKSSPLQPSVPSTYRCIPLWVRKLGLFTRKHGQHQKSFNALANTQGVHIESIQPSNHNSCNMRSGSRA